MDASSILKYGHQTFLGSLNAVPVDKRNARGVCGIWSTKDLLAHLTSFEVALVEILIAINSNKEGVFVFDQKFNDDEVRKRVDNDWETILGEYMAAHEKTINLVSSLKKSQLTKRGTIPWYGNEYSIDDLIVYQYYGHKREHSAQIDKWLDTSDTCL